MKKRPDVLLITVNKQETQAVLKAFQIATRRMAKLFVLNRRVYRDLGSINGTRVFHALSAMGSGGPGASLQTVDEAIRMLDPGAVIGIGIAFGVDEKRQEIGDVLISTQLLMYDLQRAGKKGIVLRGDKPHASTFLINYFHGIAQSSWRASPVRPGLVLTGEKLVDNIDYRNALRHLATEAVGGEMEGAGLYVSSQEHKVDWIVIKSICDWADGRKEKDKAERQRKAAKMAVDFLLHALRQAPLRRATLKNESQSAVVQNTHTVRTPPMRHSPPSDGMGNLSNTSTGASKVEQTTSDIGNIPLRSIKLIGRKSLLAELLVMLQGFAARSRHDTPNTVSLQGMPGLGKTAIALAMAYDPNIRKAFPSGIFWQSFSRKTDPFNVVARWCSGLGVPHLLDGLGDGTEVLNAKEAGNRLRAFLLRTNKRVLFILDNVADAAHLQSTLITGGGCASIITTRKLNIAEDFVPFGHRKELPRLSEKESRLLLSELVGPEIFKRHRKACRELINRLAGLPLALTVAGSLVTQAKNRGHSVGDLIARLRERTDILLSQPVPPDMRQFLNDVENPDVVAVLQLSIDDLDEESRECFAVLGDVIPTGEGTIGLEWMMRGWEFTREHAQAVADRLVAAGLIQPAKTVAGEPSYFMHDLFVQFAKTMIQQPENELGSTPQSSSVSKQEIPVRQKRTKSPPKTSFGRRRTRP